MLQDLVNVSRGKAKSPEVCRLVDIVNAALDIIRPSAESPGRQSDYRGAGTGSNSRSNARGWKTTAAEFDE